MVLWSINLLFFDHVKPEPTHATVGAVASMPAPVSFDPVIDQNLIDTIYCRRAFFFTHSASGSRECILFTLVPTGKTNFEIAEAVAAGLGKTLISPNPVGLLTFDGSHLDRPSAERWSEAFFQLAGPKIRNCLGQEKAPKL